jgi:hypothetical protein
VKCLRKSVASAKRELRPRFVPVSPPQPLPHLGIDGWARRQAALADDKVCIVRKAVAMVGRDSVTLATLPSRSTISTDDATSSTQRKGREQLQQNLLVVCSNWWDGTGTECNKCRTAVSLLYHYIECGTLGN